MPQDTIAPIGWNGPVTRTEPPFPPDMQFSRIRRAREGPHSGGLQKYQLRRVRSEDTA